MLITEVRQSSDRVAVFLKLVNVHYGNFVSSAVLGVVLLIFTERAFAVFLSSCRPLRTAVGFVDATSFIGRLNLGSLVSRRIQRSHCDASFGYSAFGRGGMRGVPENFDSNSTCSCSVTRPQEFWISSPLTSKICVDLLNHHSTFVRSLVRRTSICNITPATRSRDRRLIPNLRTTQLKLRSVLPLSSKQFVNRHSYLLTTSHHHPFPPLFAFNSFLSCLVVPSRMTTTRTYHPA